MKKLMIAVCAVALAGAVQAGSFTWANSGGINAAGSSYDEAGFSGTIYLMDGLTTSAADFYAAYYAAGANLSAFDSLVGTALNKATVTSTKYTETDYSYLLGEMSGEPKTGTLKDGTVVFGDYEAKTPYDIYQVAYDTVAGALYISESFTTKNNGEMPGPGTVNADFGNLAAYEGVKFEDAKTYQGAGWYTAVPEPTSGLLLLLGVAGLALRRRRA